MKTFTEEEGKNKGGNSPIMDARLEQIRKNLLEASASLNEILPYPPLELKQQLSEAWGRYFRLVEMVDASKPRLGKQDFGFLQFLIAGVVGLVAIMGGGAYIAHELNESERIAQLNKCIAESTKQGVPITQAQNNCYKLYGQPTGRPLIDVGVSGINTTLLLAGGLGILGLIIAGKYLK